MSPAGLCVRARFAARIRAAFLVLLTLALPAAAAPREVYFESIGSERGLTQSSVGALAQDAQGFVWVGTQGGLHRFDGERYRVYRHDPGDPGSLPDSFVTALAPARGPALWVGTVSQYVARLDLRSGAIRRFVDAAPDRRADRQVLALLAEPGAVWVGTVAGLDRLDPASSRRRRVLDIGTGHRTNAPNQALLRDRAGRLWYAAGAGLFRIDGDAVHRVGDALPAYALLEDRAGRLWLGSDRGLERVQGDARTPVWQGDTPGRPGQVRALAAARDGQLWLSVSLDGLRRFDPATGAVQAVRADPAVPGALPEDSINTLLVDRGGMLWLGGQYRGAAVGDPRGARFAYLPTLPGAARRGPAADDSVRSVIGTPGALWLGTDGDRLIRYDLANGAYDDLTPQRPTPSRIGAFAAAASGRVWIAAGGGLLELDPATRRVRDVPLPEGRHPALRSIAVEPAGALWLGTSGDGAYRYDPSTRALQHLVAGQALSHPNVHAVLVDRRGRVWFGTGDGLDVLDPATGGMQRFRHVPDAMHSLPGNLVRTLLEDAAGRVWIGTQAGLAVATSTPAGAISLRRPLDADLPDYHAPIIFSLLEAPRGTLWAGTDAGLLRYRPDRHDARLFGLGEGLQDLEFNGGSAARLPDGRLAFGGVRGINLVDPLRRDPAQPPAPLRLLSVRLGNRDLGESALSGFATLTVPPGEELLRLRIGALDFSPAARPRYRYRLDGFDTGWIDNGPQREIAYTQLPPGDYTFRAQATDRSGRWADTGLSFPVHVDAPFWRHPLMLLSITLLLLAPPVFAAWQWVQRRRRDRVHLVELREREERLKLALWASGEMFWDYDLDSGAMHRLQAHDPDGPDIGADVIDEDMHAIHPDDMDRVREQMRRHLRDELAVFESEHRIRGLDGDWMWVRARGRLVERDDDGHPRRVAGTARDVSATRRAERDRRVASEVLRSMAEAVAVFDDDFGFISVNPAFTRMTGYTEAEVAGHRTDLIDSRQHDISVYREMREQLHRDGRWSGELWQRRKDGSEFLCWLQASVVLDSMGQRGHWVAVLSDITDQKRAEQELRYLANYDTLTGLPNRALLLERISRAIARARRQDTRIAVLFLDLDRFKDINDSLGHAAGDAILRATAGRLQHVAGGHHTVARLSGDEFTVVMEHVEAPDEADALARQLLTAFEAPLDAGDLRDVIISPSIGIALYPDDADTPSDLLKHADTAMYQAKAQGRRTYMRYAGTMDADTRRRATLSAALRKVIDREELALVYQPRLSLRERRIVGVEALLRWNSSEFGPVSPAQFIPLAEESGLILEIGDWALRHAGEQLATWHAQGLDIAMSVNVSALQLRRGQLVATVERMLADTSLPPYRLEIELTESVVMAEATWPALQAIRNLGVHMSIDDFGTGYSSFAYLKRLPINALKIDREFIGDLTRDADDEAITSAVIAMGHSLGLHVVAEGVETAEQLDFLRRHGCDEIQGYWLARPMDPAACEAFMRGWQWNAHLGKAPTRAP